MSLPQTGDWVCDCEGRCGLVLSGSDPHNIDVLFANGRGLFCLVSGCDYCFELLWRHDGVLGGCGERFETVVV